VFRENYFFLRGAAFRDVFLAAFLGAALFTAFFTAIFTVFLATFFGVAFLAVFLAAFFFAFAAVSAPLFFFRSARCALSKVWMSLNRPPASRTAYSFLPAELR